MPLVSLIIPTKNEAETICEVIQRATLVFEEMDLDGEILVVDSSTDRTAEMAESCGARVIHPKKLGYGNAYLQGFEKAKGEYIMLMDGDLTYDPQEMNEFLTLLLSGDFDMVMGSRFKGKILPGSMPLLHRYVGNPFLTWLLNSLFPSGISDVHCGMRAITHDALKKLQLRTGGMEFASEMVIEATRKGLRISEVPITYYPRRGESKLNTFSDGWRHLRFILLYRPVLYLLVPGGLALMLGLALTAGVYLQAGSRMHSLILGSLMLLIGYQMLLAGLYFEAFGEIYGFSSSGINKKLISYHSLEKELLLGFAFLATGAIIGLQVLLKWQARGFGSIDELGSAVMAMVLSIMGIQTVISGMFISLLLLNNGQQD